MDRAPLFDEHPGDGFVLAVRLDRAESDHIHGLPRQLRVDHAGTSADPMTPRLEPGAEPSLECGRIADALRRQRDDRRPLDGVRHDLRRGSG